MTGWAIVAIPRNGDPTLELSSEKIPHMTLLYLGEPSADVDQAQVAAYVEFVAKTSMRPFGLEVKTRGPLGPKDADVLFFKQDSTEKRMVEDPIGYLLANPDIRSMYTEAQTFDGFTPHLTLGYPETPAKTPKDFPPGYDIGWVSFDSVALWTGDYSGPTFKLEYPESNREEMAMADNLDAFFQHFGVKGMHWGQRNAGAGSTPSTSSKGGPKGTLERLRTPKVPHGTTEAHVTPGKKVKAEGGQKYTPHEDAVKVAVAKAKAKGSTTDSLSTPELRQLVERMNLEQQYSKLAANDLSPGRKFVKEALGSVVKDQANQAIKKQVAAGIGELGKKAATASK